MTAGLDIEQQLNKLWSEHPLQQQFKACLFTLVVWAGDRQDYYRRVAQRVLEIFPCRVLFLTLDEKNPSALDVKAKISQTPSTEGNIAYETVDLTIGANALDRVPSLLVPALVPNLPVYLVWGADPSQPNSLFDAIHRYATKLIFDSEQCLDLQRFAQKLLQLLMMEGQNIADLNWVRTEPWRELIAKVMDDPQNLESLVEAETIRIRYNSCTGPFCSRTYAQAIYLQGWLASELQWSCGHYAQIEEHQRISCRTLLGETIFLLLPQEYHIMPEGQVSGVEIFSKKNCHILIERHEDPGFKVDVYIERGDTCELPMHVMRTAFERGHSLAKEVLSPGTSPHFIEMLHWLSRAKT